MNSVAHFAARRLWWAMLWLMRRAWMKRLQRASFRLFKDGNRGRAWKSFQRQNAFARRWGLRMLTAALNLLLASLAITVSFFVITYLIDTGALTLPKAVEDRLAQQSQQ